MTAACSSARPEWLALARALTSMGGAPCATSTGAPAEQAQGVCLPCGARPACLAYAIAADEPAGLWGGLTVEERRRRFPSPVVDRPRAPSPLRDLRASCGVDQVGLARRVGVSRAFIANIEAGRRRLPASLVPQIAAALGVSPSTVERVRRSLVG